MTAIAGGGLCEIIGVMGYQMLKEFLAIAGAILAATIWVVNQSGRWPLQLAVTELHIEMVPTLPEGKRHDH